MRTFWTLFKREISAYLLSPIAYVLGAIFLVMMGYLFAFIVRILSERPQQDTITLAFFNFFWLPALIIPTVITMRLLAEEKKSGTVEMLMTAPVTDWQVVLSKFAGALGLYALIWSPTLAYAFILRSIVSNPELLETVTFFTGYLLVILNAALLMAIGLLASALTRNQIIAAVLSFLGGFGVLLVPEIMTGVFSQGPLQDLFRYLSPFTHMQDFANGVIPVQPVVYYLSFTVLFLFITVRIVESRKWK